MNEVAKKTRVIFLCTGNSARSQMAEAFLRRFAGDHFEVHSAGFDPKEIHPYTRKVMEEAGYDLKGQHSKSLSEYTGKLHFGIIITVCRKAEEACPTMPGMGTRLFWDFEDPAAFKGSKEEKLDIFRKTRDIVRNRILEWLQERGIEPNT